MKFLKLIRFQNLIMLALMQLVFHFVFFKNQREPFVALTDLRVSFTGYFPRL